MATDRPVEDDPDRVVLYTMRGDQDNDTLAQGFPERTHKPETWYNKHEYRLYGGVIYYKDLDQGAWVRVSHPSEEVRREFERKQRHNSEREDLDELPLSDDDLADLDN